jgi:ABC-2 type transport system ATP-binding protein
MPSVSTPTVTVHGLTKTYRVPEREAGLKASFRSLFRPRYSEVAAVKDVSFALAAGEIVGFIGPNGAGKTTTLKVLAGLLHPTAGEVRVAGYRPWERRAEFLRQISMVLGNKSQMIWDIPPMDTFRVLGEIYHLSPSEFNRTLDELVALLGIEELLTRPVRNLSLGERMKCELVAGLLHRPSVLFLDEPTLGLDVSMQSRLRSFIGEYNRRCGATILLTSHYMADVVALCPRVILIHQGQVLYDGALNGLATRLAPFKLIRLALTEPEDACQKVAELLPEAEHIEQEDDHILLRVSREAVSSATARLLSGLAVADLTVEDPPIESVIDQVYQEGQPCG